MERSTRNPTWNVRQMLYHIITAVEMLPQDVKLIRNRSTLIFTDLERTKSC
jgi:hypothetical protein